MNCPQAGKQLKISLDKDEKSLLELINSRFGLVISATQLPELRHLVELACEQYHVSKAQYLQKLATEPQDASLIKDLVTGITIGETYFFRDKKQIQLLKNDILPKLIRNKREKNNLSLRIWSAGCAAGEELYSIIMLLDELLPDKKAWTLQLRGTDINTKVLHKALSGRYSEWSLRSTPDYYLQKYLKQVGNEYILHKNIIQQAQFDYLNLIDDDFPSIINGTNAQDLIICRNVLIYFDTDHIHEIMKKFSLCLAENGYLLLGASDPLDVIDTQLILYGDYGKLLVRAPAKPIKIKKTTEPHLLPLYKHVPKHIPSVVAVPKPKADLISLIEQSRWQDIINVIDQYSASEYNTATALTAKASALANLGQLKKAAELCEASLKLDPLKLPTYFTYALILLGLNQTKKAEAVLRKTLFLDPNFVLGHYQLGLLQIRNKKYATGMKSLKNALDITQHNNPADKLSGHDNLTFGKLAAILNEEIALHEFEESYHEK